MADDAHAVPLLSPYALESVLVLDITMMDMSSPIGKMKKAAGEPPTRIPKSGLPIEEQVFNLQRQAVVDLITEIVANADIVGQGTRGETVYLLRLSPTNADTLAALFADLEDGDPLDAGEDEHDGREPDPEDVA